MFWIIWTFVTSILDAPGQAILILSHDAVDVMQNITIYCNVSDDPYASGNPEYDVIIAYRNETKICEHVKTQPACKFLVTDVTHTGPYTCMVSNNPTSGRLCGEQSEALDIDILGK